MNIEGKNRFTLVIHLGSEAMQTPADVADALRTVAAKVELAEGCRIVDNNGNSCGEWCYEV